MKIKNKHRLFWAIDFPEELKELLLFKSLNDLNPIRLLSKKNIHLTLLFLGELIENDFKKYIKKIDSLNLRLESNFKLSLKQVGVFPNVKYPKILWIGVEHFDENLFILYKQIFNFSKRILKKKLNISKHRKFTPHITIGRFRQKCNTKILKEILEKYQHYEFGDFSVNNVLLFKSVLTPKGPIYDIIKKIKF